jgi:hypothetical protein
MILRDGVIKRSTGKTPPYAWLGSNPTNEHTANRGVLTPEQFRQCDERALFAPPETGAFRVSWVRRAPLGGPTAEAR